MVTLNKLLAPRLEALGLTPSDTSGTDIKCCWDLGSRDTDYFWVCDVFNDHVAVRSKRNWEKGELYYYEFNAADPEFIKKVFQAIDEILRHYEN